MTDAELITILKSRFGSVKKGNKDWIQIKCPSCTPRDAVKRKRGVNIRTLQTKCWLCEVPLTIADLIGRKIERIEASAYAEDPEHPQARIIPSDGVIPINELAEDHPARLLFTKDHLNDLTRYWNDNHIGYIPAESAHDIIYTHEDKPDTKVSTANSLVFPVYYHNELVGWQLRFVPGSPKFRYFHIFKKGDYLYNFDLASRFNMVIVVEGVKKALKFPNGVATLGKGISDNQIQKLLNWKNIVFIYDGEDDTQAQTQELVSEINIGSRKCICIDPRKYGFDSPDEMPEDVAQKIVFLEWRNQIKDE